MTRKMKKRNDDFAEIELLKDRYRTRILDQELRIKSGFSVLTDNLSGAALLNRVRENLFSGSGLAFRLGFLAVTLMRKKLAERKRKK